MASSSQNSSDIKSSSPLHESTTASPMNPVNTPLRSQTSSDSTTSSLSVPKSPQESNSAPKSKSKKKGTASKQSRNYFNNAEPTFYVPPPITQLEFLDDRDPDKDLVVRKKAREWVFRNKELQTGDAGNRVKKDERGTLHVELSNARGKGKARGAEARSRIGNRLEWEKSQVGRKMLTPDPTTGIAGGTLDPFGMLPQVGRRIEHIVEYFLTSCPELVPCSDDKYVSQTDKALIKIDATRANSCLHNMAQDQLSFILWLQATTLLRDGIAGQWDSEEALYYRRLSLLAMQNAVKRRVEDYTDDFFVSITCFCACSVFAGMQQAAVFHRSALLRAFTLKGDGDMLKGFLSCGSWVRKAVQWSDFMVAAQEAGLPALPYLPPVLERPFAQHVVAEIDRLTNVTLSSIPRLSNSLVEIFRWLHHISLTKSHSSSEYRDAPESPKKDSTIHRLLYDVVYSSQEILHAQEWEGHGFSNIEVMITQACQQFIWTGPRGLPAEMELCNMYLPKLKDSIISVVRSTERLDSKRFGDLDKPSTLSLSPSSDTSTMTSPYSMSSNDSVPVADRITLSRLDNAIIWALSLGTIISSAHNRPIHLWFKEQLLTRLQAVGLSKRRQGFQNLLELFPLIEGYWDKLMRIMESECENSEVWTRRV